MLTKLFAALMTVIVFFGTAVFSPSPTAPPSQKTETTVVKTTTDAPSAPASDDAYLDATRAEELAFQQLGLMREQVRFDRTELDFERGIWVWEVELWYENMAHDFVIDASTGDILFQNQEQERRDPPRPPSVPDTSEPPPQTDELTEEQAIDVALAHAGLTREQVSRLHAKKTVTTACGSMRSSSARDATSTNTPYAPLMERS